MSFWKNEKSLACYDFSNIRMDCHLGFRWRRVKLELAHDLTQHDLFVSNNNGEKEEVSDMKRNGSCVYLTYKIYKYYRECATQRFN